MEAPSSNNNATLQHGTADAAGDNNGSSTQQRSRSGRTIRKPTAFTPTTSQPASRNAGRGKRKRDVHADEEDEENASDHNGEGEEDEQDASSTEASDEAMSDADDFGRSAAGRRAAAKQTKNASGGKRNKAKKAKTTPGTSTLPLRTAASKPPAKARKPTAAQAAAAGDGELYDKVFSKGSNIKTLAASWVSQYEENHIDAMRDLVNFVLRASGCALSVTVHDIEDQDNITQKLKDLQDEYQAQAVGDYPLISRAKRTPPFRSTLENFFRALVAAAHSTAVLYTDSTLLENMQQWISTMSSSAIRPFRHTATFVLLTVLGALCEAAAELKESLATTNRQLEGERKKARQNRERVAALGRKISDGNQKYELLESVIRDVFETVFVHRYRDVDPKIRVECVRALGAWIPTLPDMFFDGSHLRYLGWILSDVYAPSRMEAIRQLQRLYEKKENVGGLRTFTERFRARIVEMATRDADPGVRAVSVELLVAIRSLGLLEADDVEAVGKLIFDAEERVRKAVVSFFVESLEDLYNAKIEDRLGGEEALEELAAANPENDADAPNLAWLKLKCLVELLRASDDEDADDSPTARTPPAVKDAPEMLVGAGSESRIALATRAFYDAIPEVRDWERLTSYLLYDHTEPVSSSASAPTENVEAALKEACKISEKEAIVLLDVLNTAVRLRLTQPGEDASGGGAGGKKKKGKRTLLTSSDVQEATALRLAQLIPKLLNIFGPVPAAASAVLRLEHVLDLEVFEQLRQDSTTYSALLDDIRKQFISHSSHSVLAEASAALLHALSFEDLQEVTETKVQRLWEDTTAVFVRLLEDRDLDSMANIPSGVRRELTDTVRRISSLAAISDCVEPLERPSFVGAADDPSVDDGDTSLGLLFRIFQHLSTQTRSTAHEPVFLELKSCVMKCVQFYFMWKLQHLQKAIADGRDVGQNDVTRLRERRDAFAAGLVRIMRSKASTEAFRRVATGTYLDLHTLFATLRQLTERSANGAEGAAGARAGAGAGGAAATATSSGSIERLRGLVAVVPDDVQKVIVSIFSAAEKLYAKKAHRTMEPPADDEAPTDDELEPDAGVDGHGGDALEEEGGGGTQGDGDAEGGGSAGGARHREKMSLLYEQQLCELTGKIVLAILASVLDAAPAAARGRSQGAGGKVRARITRNAARLGRNFKEVVAYLDEPKGGRQQAGREPARRGRPPKNVQQQRMQQQQQQEQQQQQQQQQPQPEAEVSEESEVEDDIEDDGIEGGAAGDDADEVRQNNLHHHDEMVDDIEDDDEDEQLPGRPMDAQSRRPPTKNGNAREQSPPSSISSAP